MPSTSSDRFVAVGLAVALLATACGASNDEVVSNTSDAESFPVEQVASTGREDVPSALDGDRDGLPEPTIPSRAVLPGGPPPDGIPAIDDPRFVRAADVDYVEPREPVLALEVAGEARAYPIQIMTWHELVNDTIGGVPVTVSYCPLCNSALAYGRTVGDRVLDFGTSGRLYQSSMVMYDRQTESLWTHFDGTAFAGVLTGTELDVFPMTTVSWAQWLDAHPDGLVLSLDTGHSRRYGQNPYPGYEDEAEPRRRFISTGYDGRLPAKERVVGIRSSTDAVAVRTTAVVADGVIGVELDGRSLSVWSRPGTASALDTFAIEYGDDVGARGVFVPAVDGRALTFERVADGFVDAETGSRWDIFGRAMSGPLEGSRLDRVEFVDTFWFAWASFETETRVVPSG